MSKFLKMAVAAAAVLSFGAQADVLIDDFTNVQVPVEDKFADGNAVRSEICAASGIIGIQGGAGNGCRELIVNKFGPSGTDGFSGGSMGVYGTPGQLQFDSGANQNVQGIVRWDGEGSGVAGAIDFHGLNGLVGVDLASTTNMFQVEVTYADLAFPFSLEVYDVNGNVSSFSAFSSGAQTYFIPFAWFTGTADFTKVGALQGIINLGGSTASVDLNLRLVKSVPEPTSLALAGLALLGIGAARRRKA